MKQIPISELSIKPSQLWLRDWLLLTAGDSTAYNSMTVAWGSIGGMWKKPFIQVVVRPSRYTFEFITKYPTFTLCAFDKKFHDVLQIMGTKSGRDCNKIKETGITPIKSITADAPGFKEAGLILECKKMYWQDMEPANFLEPGIADNYPDGNIHRIFFGEITCVLSNETG